MKQMSIPNKTKVLSLFALALIAIILLAAGLNEVNFRDGHYFLIGSRASYQNLLVANETNPFENDGIASVITAILAILLSFGIIIVIFWPTARKLILRLIIPIAFLALLIPALRQIGSLQIEQEIFQSDEAANITTVVSTAPEWMVYLTSFIFVILAFGILWFVISRFVRPKPTTLEFIAQGAINEIKAGADFKDTIIQCYYDMSAAVNEHRGIKRNQSMTTREFEMHLKDHGLPSKHIMQLTRLFENVRYGSKTPNSIEERQAISALQAIVFASGKES
ncbi:MAG: DUF4129 domain-containing protein [Chloroflexi bacterium]|nr:DUF4129 domain-containing protein [Chloroflexota bacterium]